MGTIKISLTMSIFPLLALFLLLSYIGINTTLTIIIMILVILTAILSNINLFTFNYEK